MESKETTHDLFLTYNEIAVLLEKFIIFQTNFRNSKQTYDHLGITCTNIYNRWWDSFEKKSNLKVVDEKKWMLAKIKYGI